MIMATYINVPPPIAFDLALTVECPWCKAEPETPCHYFGHDGEDRELLVPIHQFRTDRAHGFGIFNPKPTGILAFVESAES